MSTIKLLQKHEGRKVVLADGTRTTITKVLATAFKLANGAKIKPDVLQESGNMFKEKKAAAPAKKAATSSKSTSAGGAVNIAKMPRKECVTRLVAAKKLRVRTDARGKTVEELRALVAKIKGINAAAPEKEAPAKKSSAKAKVETAPAKSTSSKKSKSSGDKRAAPTLEQVRSRVKAAMGGKVAKGSESASTSKKKSKQELDLKPVVKITPKIAKSVEEVVQEKIGSFLQRITGYDFVVATVGGIHNDTCMTLQIGLMNTAATEEEKQEYADSIHDAAEEATEDDEDDDLGELNELDDDLDPDEEEEEEEDETESEEEEDESEEEGDELDELDDAEEEEDDGDEEESEDDETEGEEEFEEEEGEELDEAALLSEAVDATGLPVKALKPLVSAWVANFEKIEDALGDEVTIGTGLISNKSGDVLIVIGYNEDKDKIALFNTESEKTTAAAISEVARMEFAEEETEEEAAEEEDEEAAL